MRAYLEAARENRKLRKIALVVAVFAAVLVVFGVFWALKNTGIAMTGDPTCGFVEHTHTDACYEKTLVCGQEESQGHTHSVENGCYAAPADDAATASTEQTLTCTIPEIPAHTHTDACYQQTLTCTTPEHTHTRSCYGDAETQGQITKTHKGGDYTIQATYGPEAQLPKNVELSVRELTGEEYDQHYQQAMEAVDATELSFARFFDVTFMANGKEVEPAAPVDVKVTYDNVEIPEDQSKNAIHFAEDGIEVLNATVEQKDGEATFEHTQDSFTVIGDFAGTYAARAATPDAVATVDNNTVGITMNLFDYGALDDPINKADIPEYTNGYDLDSGINSGNRIFRFVNQGASENNTINSYVSGGGAKQGIVNSTLTDGYPTLRTDDSSLDYLFDLTEDSETYFTSDSQSQPASIPYSKKVFPNANGLLFKEEDGSYTFDSSQYRACFDQANSNFDVYKKEGYGFFPFDSYDSHDSKQISEMNHFFGLTMSASFKMPKNGQVNGKDMIFKFSGDDDVWVFIDGVLVLDLGGIHDKAGGSINFAEGKVNVDVAPAVAPGATSIINPNGNYASIGELFRSTGKSYNDSEGSTHTIDLFYLERGSGGSDCYMKFNLPLADSNDSGNSGASGSDSTAKLSVRKSVDAFVDNAGNGAAHTNNQDTTLDDGASADLADYNRLYLEAQPGLGSEPPIDLLLVVDRSGSMTEPFGSNSRMAVLRNILGLPESPYGKGPDGLIDDFLAANGENKIAMIGFSSMAGWPYEDAAVLMNWKNKKAFDSDQSLQDAVGATNYCASFKLANELLNDSKVRNDGHRKVMIFLSDGVPTIYYDDSENRTGSGTEETSNTDDSIPATKKYFDKCIKPLVDNPDESGQRLTCYTVGISEDATKAPETLQYMADRGGGQYFAANQESELRNALKGLMYGLPCTNVVISDPLSDYVDIADQPDYKVTLKTKDSSNPTELTVENGKLQSVGYDSDTRTVTAKFADDFTLNPGETITLSFNVKTNEAAHKAYEDNNKAYLDTGDPNTDYASNFNTSSGKSGFYSNGTGDREATITYKVDGKNGSTTFPHPVVQIATDTSSSGGGGGTVSDGTLSAHKTIDAFRDGADNPDTEVDNEAADKTNLYRLYLDAELKQTTKPIDLLIIVDQSGSMHPTYSSTNNKMDMKKENNQPAYRDEALRLVLNGTSDGAQGANGTAPSTYEANKQNGLIYQFLNANDANQVAVVGFQGAGYIYARNYKYGEDYWFQQDSDGSLDNATNGKIQTDDRGGYITKNYAGVTDTDGYYEAMTLLDWTSDAQFVDVQGIPYNATNYTAGLLQAKRVMSEPSAKNDHQKVILFLSDGEPTAHIAYGGAREAQGWPGYWEYKPAISDHYYRAGTGNTKDTEEINNYLSDLMKVYPDAILHTVSIADGNAQKVLTDMTRNGGSCYQVTDTAEMMDKLNDLMQGMCYSKLVIQDKLSDYVELHGTPDYKVTRKEADGTVNTLYEKGTVTTAGQGIIESVSYDKQSKTVTAKFVDSYIAEPGTTITLSFNVETNQYAYDTFAQTGYDQDESGQAVITGDTDTDYKDSKGNSNATSSGQEGFHSNDKATLTYTKGNESTPSTADYPHPVVQVASCDLVLKKVNESDSALAGAEFDLYQEIPEGDFEEADGFIKHEGVAYKKVKTLEPTAATNTDTAGQVKVTGLAPGKYCLVETKAPAGYEMLTEPVSFELKYGTGNHGEIAGSTETIKIGGEDWPLLKVKNKAGYELPMTGGLGIGAFLGMGAVLVACTGFGLASRRRRGMRA